MDDIEVSVVMPCLNEENTVGTCVSNALEAFRRLDIKGEVIVCDNGSTDNSIAKAKASGAKVVHETVKGYGSALMKGISEAEGKYIVMGDSDDTYDFRKVAPFIQRLREGYDLVMGSRLEGEILPGAMPWLHKHLGNPILTGILNLLFRAGVSDAHCGMRAFRKEAYHNMDLQTTGMEFASEMVIMASKAGFKIAEVPITYYPRVGESKLHSFRDGWRHLRFMLLYSPTYLFLTPGFLLSFVGLSLLLVLLRGPVWIGNFYFGIHYMVLGSLLTILGLQTASLGLSAKIYARAEHFEQSDKVIDALLHYFNLERGILIGLVLLGAGLAVFLYIVYVWSVGGSGFDELIRLRQALFAMTLVLTGVQTVFSSFFLSLMIIRRV